METKSDKDFDKLYRNVVREVQGNFERINMFNLLKDVRSNGKKNKRKRK